MSPSNAALILLYHRIAELTSDPQRLAVTPEHFAEHLEVLRDRGCPASLAQLGRALDDRRLAGRAIAVTFDDGYGDNVDCAKPLLERYEIPATVFVATAYLGADREFWWDDLERLLLLPGELPETLRLPIGSTFYEWHLGDASVYCEDVYRRHSNWNVEAPHDPSPRHSVYRGLCRLMRAVPDVERSATLDELARLAGMSSTGRPTHRALQREGLIHLTEGGVIEVGAHASTHTTLSALPLAAQRSEIVESKTRLEEMSGQTVTSFAYPFGGRADYSRATVGLVQSAGFTLACANGGGLVRARSHRFELPRMIVRDWDADSFAARLREWLGD